MIPHNEGIKRRLIREETRGINISTYGVEKLRRLLGFDRQSGHRLLYFCFKVAESMKSWGFVGPI